MAKVSAAQEPSMEEILASIRRIISEDEHGLASPKTSELTALPAKIPSVPVSAADIDALFSARVAEFASPPPAAVLPEVPAAAPVSTAASLDEPRMLRPAAPEPARAAEPVRSAEPPRAAARATAPAAAAVRPVRAHADEPAAEPLLSPAADAIVNSAFGNLANTVLAGNSRSLEDLVKDMLRPMLKAWLDTNLPPLVERLVRDEIERVSRGR